MKIKKSLSRVLIYALIFTVLNVVIISEKVQALEEYSTYVKEPARNGNIYNIKGDILKVEQYADYTLAVTEKTIYFIEDGQAKKYDLGESEILSSTTITRDGNYIYLIPCKKNNDYILLTIDKEKFQGTQKPISKYMNYENYSYNILLQEAMVDKGNNKWFSLYNKDESAYELLKANNLDNSDAKIIWRIREQDKLVYTHTLKNIKLDSNDNIWFKITEISNGTEKHMLGKVSKDGGYDSLTFRNVIIDYEIADDGSIWVIHEDKIIHSKANGEIQREYKGTYVKDICKDILGNIWLLEENRILQLVNHEFKLEYEIRSESKELSVRDKNNISIRNIDGITRIAKGQREEIYVDSYNDVAVGTVPENYEDKTIIIDEEVHESKEWVIKFNQQLDDTTVNNSNVIVINSSGEKQGMEVLLDSDNRSIKITPEKKYVKGQSYYIIIKETIKSLSGRQLNEPMLVKFVVADDKISEDSSAIITELDKVKFEIVIPTRLGTRDKSFIDYVVNNWRKSYEEEAKSKGEILKVGKATILEVSVGTSTAYISFDVEVHTATNKEISKEIKSIDLNCKKQEGVWKVVK